MNCNGCGLTVRLNRDIRIPATRDDKGKIIDPGFAPKVEIAYCEHCGNWTSYKPNALESLEEVEAQEDLNDTGIYMDVEPHKAKYGLS